MNCHNENCRYHNKKYVGNCWDIGEADDCEEAYSSGGWKKKQVSEHAKFLSGVDWSGLPLEVLAKVREVAGNY